MKVHDAERARLKGKRWIQSFTGRSLSPLDLQPGEVCIEDIAHHLALENRYTGATYAPYSVAQHSCLVSALVPQMFKLAALLHDAAEYVLHDFAAPVKHAFYVKQAGKRMLYAESVGQLEDHTLDTIFEGLGLSDIRYLADSEEVKKADLQLLAWEARDLLKFDRKRLGAPRLKDWHLTQKAPVKEKLTPWDWTFAEVRFLSRFKELTK